MKWYKKEVEGCHDKKSCWNEIRKAADPEKKGKKSLLFPTDNISPGFEPETENALFNWAAGTTMKI